MSGKVFLDSNIFIYAYDESDPRKQSIAIDLIRTASVGRTGVISYQVVQEFFKFALVEAAVKMSHVDAQLFLANILRPLLAVHSSASLVAEAIRTHERYRLSWYDSLIVCAAQQAGCDLLYTEDLQDGQRFEDLTVYNPFR